MESDPDVDGPVYLIELEEKLAGLQCASVIVDQHHCGGKRSLRWDLIPFRDSKSILHAKISLLCWSNCIRVIFGSANLTNDGYRRNQEIFGVIDLFEDSTVPTAILKDTIQYLTILLNKTDDGNGLPETQRLLSFFKKVSLITTNWTTKDISSKRRREIFVHPVFIHPNGIDLFEQLRTYWSNYSGPPKNAEVISPFFNPVESKNLAVRSIWKLLNQKGKANLTYVLTYELNPEKKNVILLHGPESLNYVPPNRKDVKVDFQIIDEQIKNEKSKSEQRPLHQKSIWLENDDWVGYLVGSSNFTSAGCGLGKFTNYEANFFYMVSKLNNPKGYRLLKSRQLNSTSINNNLTLQWLRQPNLDELENDLHTILSESFGTVHFNLTDGIQYLVLKFTSMNMPNEFQIRDEKNELILYNEKLWLHDKKQLSIQLRWEPKYLPSGVNVIWDNNDKPVWWPINVSDFSVLPPPEELKDLPLDVLISLISSSRPLHHVLRKWLRKKVKTNESGLKPELDPHKKVDVSGFLLQRTRKISYALNTLKKKLERPTFTQETLNWRLNGPVGVKALVKAILKEAKSDEEKAFLVAEIALELANIYPQESINSLKQDQVRQKYKGLIKELYSNLKDKVKIRNKAIERYMKKCFNEALNGF